MTETKLDALKGEQLSDLAIRARLRAATPKAIAKLIELCDSKNPSVAMGAAKVILSKVAPDLKATELTGKDGETLPFTIIIQKNESSTP